MIDQSVFNAILRVVTALPGFSVEIFGRLMIRSLEDGQFAVDVLGDNGKIDEEDLFIAPDKAVERFLNLREELQLGLDFEGKTE